MPYLTGKKIKGKWHLPGDTGLTHCGIKVIVWDRIGAGQDIRDACRVCYQAATGADPGTSGLMGFPVGKVKVF